MKAKRVTVCKPLTTVSAAEQHPIKYEFSSLGKLRDFPRYAATPKPGSKQLLCFSEFNLCQSIDEKSLFPDYTGLDSFSNVLAVSLGREC